jgi:hypothetical protein
MAERLTSTPAGQHRQKDFTGDAGNRKHVRAKVIDCDKKSLAPEPALMFSFGNRFAVVRGM